MKVPVATYRLQFNPDFDFKAAEGIVDYLAALGISDIYSSPIFKAAKNSMHGYDVTDPLAINPELGGMEAFNRLIAAAQAKKLGWIQDIVPNHMAYSSDNKMLMDVFENGSLSAFAPYFDLEFGHPYENLKNKILAPFLGEFYGSCLEKNQINLAFDESGFSIRYADWVFPLRIDSYLTVLIDDLGALTEKLGKDNDFLLKFMEVTQMLNNITAVTDPKERTRQIIFIKSLLWNLYAGNERIKSYIEESLQRINNKTMASPLMDDLDKLLGEQFFRLAFWKVGNEELNYRRFFTVNSLVCLRIEHDEAFEYTHRLIFQLLNEGKFTGLRIDHMDGLYDPQQYLKKLKDRFADTYIVVEKIFDYKELMPEQFNVEGTTGYDFLNMVNGIFVKRENENKINDIYTSYTKMTTSFLDLVALKKQLFIGKHMAGDIDNLAYMLKRLLNHNRYGRDLTLYGLKRALVDVLALFPVYRTYVNSQEIQERDAYYIRESLASARNKNPGAAYELDAIEKTLLLRFDPDVKPAEKEEWLHFLRRFQQYTGPLMAKGAEDTTFYIYNRLISLNEVGGNPSVFGLTNEQFHQYNLDHGRRWPHKLNTTSTHDTKRGEDARGRINVLSEIPLEWGKMVKRWEKVNASKKTQLKRGLAPDRNDEYFIYQTCVGIFPFERSEYGAFQKRMEEYIIKAIREAKVHTAWIKPDEEYEQACVNFVREILKQGPENQFLRSFIPFQRNVARAGIINSLAQTLIKLTAPGVPDFYQGTELWDLSLVDPDNRRAVDYQKRIQYLNEIKSREAEGLSFIDELMSKKKDGRIKMFLIRRLLGLRQQFRNVFDEGEYMPLQTTGALNGHLLAFGRRHEDRCILTVVPRCMAKESDFFRIKPVWKDTAVILPQNFPQHWKNHLTAVDIKLKDVLHAEELFEHFPAAVLINK